MSMRGMDQAMRMTPAPRPAMRPSPKRSVRGTALALLASSAFVSPAHAATGMFEHGNGIKAMGMGGASYSLSEESTVLGANPAHALTLGNRFDVGLDLLIGGAEATYAGNAAGPDTGYESDGRDTYGIPQGGMTRRLSDRWGAGITLLNAGLGPDYDGSPYERFGGARRAGMTLASTGVVTALAYQLTPVHTVGAGLNFGYQEFSVKGLDFVASPTVSRSPGHVTDQGKDGAFNVGFSVGWHAHYAPWLRVGAGYRSKNLTQRHDAYRGLIAERGSIELPAIFGGGITLSPWPRWSFSIEAQRYDYAKQRAFRNRLGNFPEALFGDANGPGFGWNSQNVYKFGVRWEAHPRLVLRAGYLWTTKIVQPTETLFNAFAAVLVTDQFTLGATWTVRDWELSGYGFVGPENRLAGRDSIPESFGGGEMNLTNEAIGVGLSIGRRFGAP